MFKIKQILIIGVLLVLCNCKVDTAITFTESSISTENNTLVTINMPVAHGSETLITPINSTIKTMVIAALQFGDSDNVTSGSIEESIDAFNQEYKRFITDFPESTQPWEAQIDSDIMYESPEIISIAITSYVNTGGAHGVLNIALLNFDAQTGKPVSNGDLFKDLSAFKHIAKPYFEEATKDKGALFDAATFELPANIGYSESGILLLYNTYEIAPYSAGIIEFTIPIEKVTSLLNFNGF